MTKVDTSGYVGPMPAGPMDKRFLNWSDLSPFLQGYVEEVLTEIGAAFQMLAPESLAQIVADWNDIHLYSRSWVNTKEGGACFWFDRQSGRHTGLIFPRLAVQLDNNGKVVFS